MELAAVKRVCAPDAVEERDGARGGGERGVDRLKRCGVAGAGEGAEAPLEREQAGLGVSGGVGELDFDVGAAHKVNLPRRRT